MAFKDFSNIQYIKTIDTGEEIRMGGFKVASNSEIEYMRPTIYINNGTITNEEMRVNIYSDYGTTSKIFSSSWTKLSDISGMTTLYWIGWVRVDFNREPLNKYIWYYPAIELRNYTRVFGGLYIGAAYDFPFPKYDNGQPYFYRHPLQLEIFGYSRRTK